MIVYRRLLFGIFLLSCINGLAQVERRNILRAVASFDYWQKKDSVCILEIDYTDSHFAKYKILSLSGKTVKTGFLNRELYNTPTNSDEIIIVKKNGLVEGVSTFSYYTHFNPYYLFMDTTDLLEYDYRHLLNDSMQISYHFESNIIDTCNYKIYKSNDGFYYSQYNGVCREHTQKDVVRIINMQEYARDLFTSEEKIFNVGILTYEINELIFRQTPVYSSSITYQNGVIKTVLVSDPNHKNLITTDKNGKVIFDFKPTKKK